MHKMRIPDLFFKGFKSTFECFEQNNRKLELLIFPMMCTRFLSLNFKEVFEARLHLGVIANLTVIFIPPDLCF